MDPHIINAMTVEILSVTLGKIDSKPVVLLQIRPAPETSFESMPLAISREQANRLFDDLGSLFETSDYLRGD